MSIQESNILSNSNSSKEIKSLLNLYCQPCLKRGLMNRPSFVNLNEFENNRYICESCSLGQTYIIALGKEFFSNKQKEVKLEKRLKILNESNQKESDLQSIQPQLTNELNTQIPTNPSNDQINPTQPNLQIQDTQQPQDIPQLPQFVKNIQINSNPESKYSIADIDMYTENITHEYKQAMNVIQKYQHMITSHINKWKNKLKAQFQGVIGTFGNATVGLFLSQLRSLEEMEKKLKILEERLRQEEENEVKGESQKSNQNQNQQTKIFESTLPSQNSQLKTNIKSQKCSEPSLHQLYEQSLNLYKTQQQKITLYVETLKMSGVRNLSNLKSLYNCCKGFSDAVRILISLEHKQTNRRFDFISQKFKVCSIETLYDAQMINGGYLDNRLQRPPGFDIIGQHTEKKSFKQVMKQDFNERKKIQTQILKQIPPNRLRKQDDIFISQQVTQKSIHEVQHQQKTQKQKFLQNHQEISLISSQSQREESFIEFNQKQDHQKPQQDKIMKQENINKKIQLQKQDNLQREKISKMRFKKPFSSGLLNMNFIERQDINQTLRLEKQKQQVLNKGNQNGNEIDLQNYTSETEKTNETQLQEQNPNSPFPALRQYYQYQKGQNEFVSKLQLTKQNFETFPSPNIYMPSVESLTIKYCPPATDPWELLKTLKNCFRKLTQLVIEQPKIATKQMIIMIAEYFPKLKSLVIRCKNEFDWELGKLFEKKMGQLVRFQVNEGQKS